MEVVPVMFKLERKSFLPILTVTGISKNLPVVDSILISKAIDIIELSQNKLKGKLINLMGHEHEIKPEDGMISIRFYIMFQNDEELNQAITRIQKELG